MATIQEVARLAGVSTATVSRSFNSPGLLSKETERRVLEVAERLNYRPRKARVSRSRNSQESGLGTATIGFQFFAASQYDTLAVNDFYGPVLAGAMDEASELGLNLLVHTTHRKRLYEELPKMVRDQAVAGMLLVGTADHEVLDTFSAQISQIVLVDNRDSENKYDGIVSDGFRGATEAVEYLRRLGHRRIGFVWRTPEIVTFRDRYHGYLCAMHENGLPVDPRDILCTAGTDDASHLESEMEEFVGRSDRPTAVFCVNDFNAVAFMRACRTRGVRVPDDISIVGFDDIQLASHSHPALTTIRVPKEYLGRLGVRRLLYHLQNPGLKDEPPILIEVPVTLVERHSCRSL